MVDTLTRLLERIAVEPPVSGRDSDQPEAGPASIASTILFQAQDSAARAAEESLRVLHAASAAAAQQRTSLDAATDQLRAVDNRGRDLHSASLRAREALERLRLIALNAGLEGLRLGDPSGKALVTVAEELRVFIQRGAESLDEISAIADQLDAGRTKLREELVAARGHGSTLAEELLRAQGTQHETRRAVGDMGSALQASAGIDREVAAKAGAAANHARQLAEALDGLLGSTAGRALAVRTLGPTLDAIGAVSAVLRDERNRQP